MTIDQVARRAGADLRKSVMRDLDVDAAFTALEGTWRRRRRVRVVAAGLTAAAAATVALTLLPGGLPKSEDARPSGQDTPNHCIGRNLVTCPSERTVLVEGFAPYRVNLAPGQLTEMRTSRSPEYVDFFQLPRNRADSFNDYGTGVTVISGAVPVDAPTGALGTQDLATWVASRSYLVASPPQKTEVDGLPAWRVDVALRRGEPQSQDSWCNGYQSTCHALLQPDMAGVPWESGPWKNMHSSYTFVDVPGPRTVVVWSWTFGSDTRRLRLNDELIDSLSFQPQS